ncbi:hypothetical protein ACIGXM_10350 [Kitasatospora sp. NPDC052896]|uniref:maltokinase N-terminal cap-like domain-containing protein n=1 Tax=Kitasatospora sp. NPDC052896 TaxID=3364061 RepID=UPI0037C53070
MTTLFEALPAPGLTAALTHWLPRQRWFADKGRSVRRVALLHQLPFAEATEAGGPAGALVVVRVDFVDSAQSTDYLLPLGARTVLPSGLRIQAVAELPGAVVYDALEDPELVTRLVRLIAAGESGGGVRFEPELPAFRPSEQRLASRRLGVEQSNSSVVVDDQYLLKVFRKLVPGTNPDLELQRLLRDAKSTQVPRLLGAVEGPLGAGHATFGLLQEYVPAATEGWQLALTDLRRLLEGERPAGQDEPAGPFAAEAARLGAAVATVHDELAALGGTVSLRRADLALIAGRMTTRLDAALELVPELAVHRDRVRAVFAAVADLSPELAGDVQRIHGDLHLGQVLRSPSRWLVIDFEGEPAAPRAERGAMHPPAKDLAGMLRSFDYAAHHQLQQSALGVALDRPGTLVRQWTTENQLAFCTGYASVSGRDPGSHGILLTAYQLDKAIYELCYEIRNRPGWAWIPLSAVGRLLTPSRA